MCYKHSETEESDLYQAPQRLCTAPSHRPACLLQTRQRKCSDQRVITCVACCQPQWKGSCTYEQGTTGKTAIATRKTSSSKSSFERHRYSVDLCRAILYMAQRRNQTSIFPLLSTTHRATVRASHDSPHRLHNPYQGSLQATEQSTIRPPRRHTKPRTSCR